jgi:predicted house-cleaning noncanonical NTP pyrophosphatase (MazG superfamily)
MSRPDRLTGSVGAPFHPVSHYSSPADVLNDEALSPPEKRAILSSWASDMYAVDSCPALRKIPGLAASMHLEDILTALRRLDKEENASGGEASFAQLTAQANRENRQPRIVISAKSRWSREANVRRYRRLLATHLTENERRFVQHRLAEELAQLGVQSNVAEASESQ